MWVNDKKSWLNDFKQAQKAKISSSSFLPCKSLHLEQLWKQQPEDVCSAPCVRMEFVWAECGSCSGEGGAGGGWAEGDSVVSVINKGGHRQCVPRSDGRGCVRVHTNGARMLFFYCRVAAAEHCKLGHIPNRGALQINGGEIKHNLGIILIILEVKLLKWQRWILNYGQWRIFLRHLALTRLPSSMFWSLVANKG